MMERAHPGDAWTVLRRWGITSCVGILFAAAAVSGASSKADFTDQGQATANVSVDLTSKRQVMQGFGSSERVWTDPHLSNNPQTIVPAAARRQILQLLYTRLGLTRVRPILDQGVQKERGSPFAFGGKLADAHVAFVKEARRYGLKTVFPGPVYLEPWMGAGDVDAYVDWAMAMMERWRSRGVELAYYAPQNEPQVNGNFAPDFLRRVVIQLGTRLRKAGFKTKLIVPDDENPVDAYRRAAAILADPAARRYVGALAYHIYRVGDTTDIRRLGELASRYGVPVWMTEYSDTSYANWPGALDWAVRVHTLIAEGKVSAVDYFSGFFGSWAESSTMISITFRDGLYQSISPTPVYWLTGQWSRWVRPGYRRVAVTSESDPVLTSAFTGSRRAVIVSVNRGDSETAVRYSVLGSRLGTTITSTRTSDRERWRTLPPIRSRGSRFTATLPARSVTTFLVPLAG